MKSQISKFGFSKRHLIKSPIFNQLNKVKLIEIACKAARYYDTILHRFHIKVWSGS